jgi:UTP-glucose-1-phosphate uridylyltransferase
VKVRSASVGNIAIPRFVEQPEIRGQTDAIRVAHDLVSGDALIVLPDMLFGVHFSAAVPSPSPRSAAKTAV